MTPEEAVRGIESLAADMFDRDDISSADAAATIAQPYGFDWYATQAAVEARIWKVRESQAPDGEIDDAEAKEIHVAAVAMTIGLLVATIAASESVAA